MISTLFWICVGFLGGVGAAYLVVRNNKQKALEIINGEMPVTMAGLKAQLTKHFLGSWF